MLSFHNPKISIIMNPTLRDYCRKSTEMSIIKLTEKYNLERKKPKIDNLLYDGENNKPEFNFYGLFTFLSISSLAFFFYKRLQ